MTPDGSMSVKELVLLLHRKIDQVLDDHERRIRSLERWHWRLIGGMAVLTSGAGALVAFLTSGWFR